MRADLHTHTVFSDGELIPAELVRRAMVLGHDVIAITDHVDMTRSGTSPSSPGSTGRSG